MPPSYPQPYLPGSRWAAGTAMDNSNKGEGSPQGIKGADILVEARVLAVADAIED